MLTDRAGGILGRGSALSWSQLETMVADARADGARGLIRLAPCRLSGRSESEGANWRSAGGSDPSTPAWYPSASGLPGDSDR